MCVNCEPAHEPEVRTRRQRIWELDSGWHCSIVGTCLTLADLRVLGRKLGLRPKDGFPVDYQLHGHFVGEAAKFGQTAKFLNKLLDRKHAAAINRLDREECPRTLLAAWEEALADGDIPGPYWAILTHPHADTKLAERMFADVHMLSHLVGASNRADIRRLDAMETELDEARERLERERRRSRENIGGKDRIINDLRTKLAAAVGKAQPHPVVNDGRAVAAAEVLREQAIMATELRMLRVEVDRREREAAELRATVDGLRAECETLERTVLEFENDGTPGNADGQCVFDLGGRCVLYVGGRHTNMPKFRELVRRCNGELLYHDGGIEKSMGELTNAIQRADTVVFPCDCVSHDAVCNVKKLCRQQMKTYVPLRSSGLASFIAGLRSATTAAEAFEQAGTPAGHA